MSMVTNMSTGNACPDILDRRGLGAERRYAGHGARRSARPTLVDKLASLEVPRCGRGGDVRMYAPDDYEGTLMCLDAALEEAEWSGCRVIGVYRPPELADINVADLTGVVVDWIAEDLRYDETLSWDEGGPVLRRPDADCPIEVAVSNALHGAIAALLDACLDLSGAAWQHERDIWLPEWPDRCSRLWGVCCSPPDRRCVYSRCVPDRLDPWRGFRGPWRAAPRCGVPT